ncbi:uncharacterized protein HfgLR_14960 [Haloferax gibbonsii]|uniref:Uncharacterized protein n=1 Tax=Haloferax gibbonsii TaxID=35746 RepID=A0A871BK18_HALGI|nr:hypothetical protein [Haloferax gibbonsii]QOS13120.1 uncharacterized protein HfgLR_14960 [Haloferax gibbonsii]
MPEDIGEVLPDDEAMFHHRLWMIDEFDGVIDGEKKFHKSLVEYREEAELDDSWPFVRASWGPMDPGFSSILEAYDDLELVYKEKDGQIHIYKETEKGSKYIQGLINGLRILKKDQTEAREKELRLVAKVNKDRLGSEIEKDELIQKLKEAPLGSEI